MKVVHFINSMDPGGAEAIVLSLAKNGLTKHIEVHSFGNPWLIEQCAKAGVVHVTLPEDIQKYKAIHFLPIFGFKYGSFLKKRGVHILHSHLYGATLRGAAASFFSDIPHIATQHDIYTIEDKPDRIKWLQWVLKLTNTRIVTISHQMKDFYEGYGLPRRRVSMIHNGVDTDKFHPEDNRPEDGDIIFISTGRLEKIKGFDALIKAFRKARESKSNIRLRIVGDGPEMSHLMSLAVNDSHIGFLGARQNVDVLLRSSDVYIQTSHSEGLSISIAEAISSGLPIIATNVGGNRELVEDGENGNLVPVGAVDYIAERIVVLAGEFGIPGRMQEMQNYSRGKALSHFSVEKMVESYQKLYVNAWNNS